MTRSDLLDRAIRRYAGSYGPYTAVLLRIDLAIAETDDWASMLLCERVRAEYRRLWRKMGKVRRPA